MPDALPLGSQEIKKPFRSAGADWGGFLRLIGESQCLRILILCPRQAGPGKRLVEKYGDSLLCVRHRYDEISGERLKTAEIIVEKKGGKPSLRYRDEDVVSVSVAFTEKSLRHQLKAVGGRWDSEERVWRVRYGLIRDSVELTDWILRSRIG